MTQISLMLTLLAIGGLLGVEPAAAQETYKTPWCNTSSGIGKECYQNLAQSQQDQQGLGGFCAPTSDFDPQHPMGYGRSRSALKRDELRMIIIALSLFVCA